MGFFNKHIDIHATETERGLRLNLSHIGGKDGDVNMINLNKKVGFSKSFKRRLHQDFDKWESILHERLMPENGDVYYVNGIATDIPEVQQNIECIESYFNIEGVKAIYNPTVSSKAPTWLRVFFDFNEAKNDYFWKSSEALRNSISISVLALLIVSKEKNVKIGLIGSSQGSMIIYNALRAFHLMTDDDSNLKYIQNNVKILTVGHTLTDVKADISSENYGALNVSNSQDWLSQALSGQITHIYDFDMKYHHLIWYLPSTKCFESFEEYKEAKSKALVPSNYF